MNYVPLNIKTEYSMLNSLIKVNDLIEFALKNNIKSLTITDNNMHGTMEFYKACIKNNIKPIIGLEIQINNFKIILYAKNYQGYKNLIKLHSCQIEKDLTLEDIFKYSNNLVCIVPYNSIVLYNELDKIFEYIFKSYEHENERLTYSGSNCVYMNEIRYLDKKDAKYLRVLNNIKDGKTLIENNTLITGMELKLIQDISDKFKSDLSNNNKIIEICNLEIKKDNDLLPEYKCPNEIDAYSYLKKLCIVGLKNKFGDKVNIKYKERLKYELNIINEMGFCNYFLIVWDYIKYARDNDILVGPGRGSAASSLVSYLLNITDVDPLEYNLLFERFLNPERISMPDIDIDFQDDKRDLVTKYCANKYGDKRVVGIVTFSTMKSKQVIRDVARVLELTNDYLAPLIKLIDSNDKLMTNYNGNPKLRELIKTNKKYQKLFKIALKLEGLKRQTSVHAAGIIICKKDVDDVIPIIKNGDMWLTGYSMQYLEELGLLKMDFLALKNLTIISSIVKRLKEDNINIDINNIDLNDSKIYEIFQSGNTDGIFQFESDGIRNFLRKFKPENINELVATIALYRPGPMGYIDTFIKRMRNNEKVEYIDSLKPVLSETMGIMVYQEQIMQVAHIMAGYSLGEADILRKAVSKKQVKILEAERSKFISNSIKKGYTEKEANKTFEDILKFASYGFNKAHSVAYGKISIMMAYLKKYYLPYFMCSLLSGVIGSSTKTKEYIYESKANNIKILKPDINLSYKDYKIEEYGIRFPLANIKNVGDGATRLILEERSKGNYNDIYDFVSRIYSRGVNRKTIESLIMAGAFDSFMINKQTLINNMDLIINYGEITKDISIEYVDKPMLENFQEYSKHDLMLNELDLFGFYLSSHPITELKTKDKNIVILNDINKYFDKNITTAVYIDRIKVVDTKKGDKMCFITGSDEITNIDLVMFPKIFEKYNNINVGDIIKINCKVEKRFDKFQLIINDIIN